VRRSQRLTGAWTQLAWGDELFIYDTFSEVRWGLAPFAVLNACRSPRALQLLEGHIRYITSRINTYTDVAYKDDPTIIGYNLFNEPRWARLWHKHSKALKPSSDSLYIEYPGVQPMPSVVLTEAALRLPVVRSGHHCHHGRHGMDGVALAARLHYATLQM